VDSDDSDSFFNSVSRIFSRGCHESGCAELEVRMLDNRRENFEMIINDVFSLKPIPKSPSNATSKPTRRITQQPTEKPAIVATEPPQTAMQPMTANPVDVQQIDSRPLAQPNQPPPSDGNPGDIHQIDPRPLAQPNQPPPSGDNTGDIQQTNHSPPTQSEQPLPISGNVGEAQQTDPRPAVLPEQSPSNSGNLGEASFIGDTYNVELIDIEGNFANRISAKQVFRLKQFAVATVFYYHIV